MYMGTTGQSGKIINYKVRREKNKELETSFHDCFDNFLKILSFYALQNGNIHNVMYPNSPQTSTSGGGMGEGGSNSTIV